MYNPRPETVWVQKMYRSWKHNLMYHERRKKRGNNLIGFILAINISFLFGFTQFMKFKEMITVTISFVLFRFSLGFTNHQEILLYSWSSLYRSFFCHPKECSQTVIAGSLHYESFHF